MSAQLRLPFVFSYHPPVPVISQSKLLARRRRRAANAAIINYTPEDVFISHVLDVIKDNRSRVITDHFSELAKLMDGVQSNNDESPAQLARSLLLHMMDLKR